MHYLYSGINRGKACQQNSIVDLNTFRWLLLPSFVGGILFTGLENQILLTIRSIYELFGWPGIFVIMVFENATGLSPSELILGLAGWMLLSAQGAHQAMILAGGLIAALGSTIGASCAYWVIRLGGRPLVERVLAWFHLPARLLEEAEHQFMRYGPGIVLFGRLLPGARNLVTLSAGLSRMAFLRYVIYTFIGTYIYCTVLIGVGYWVGHEFPIFLAQYQEYAPWVLAIVAFTAMLLLAGWLYRNKLRPQKVTIASDPEDSGHIWQD